MASASDLRPTFVTNSVPPRRHSRHIPATTLQPFSAPTTHTCACLSCATLSPRPSRGIASPLSGLCLKGSNSSFDVHPPEPSSSSSSSSSPPSGSCRKGFQVLLWVRLLHPRQGLPRRGAAARSSGSPRGRPALPRCSRTTHGSLGEGGRLGSTGSQVREKLAAGVKSGRRGGVSFRCVSVEE